MRRIVISFLLLLLVPFQMLLAQPVTEPLSARHYTWDNNNQRWLHDLTYLRGYNALGQLAGEEVRLPNDTISHRKLLAYNAEGKLVETLVQFWKDNDWQDYSHNENEIGSAGLLHASSYSRWINGVKILEQKVEYAYDIAGNRTGEVHYQRMDESVEVTYQLKYNHKYSVEGTLLSTVTLYPEGEEWRNYRKSNFERYLNGEKKKETIQVWLRVKGKFKWVDQKSYTFQYDSQGNVIEILQQDFDLVTWQDVRKQTFVHFEFGGYEETSYYSTAGGWEPEYQKIRKFDSKGIELTHTQERWNGSDWYTLSSHLKQPAYNPGGLLHQEVWQMFDPGLQTYLNREKWEYSDFLTFEPFTTDFPQSTFATKGITLSPNPVKTLLNIEIADNLAGFQYQIVDIHGKVIKKYSFEKNTHQLMTISVEELPVGVYVIQIQTNEGIASRKFVKN